MQRRTLNDYITVIDGFLDEAEYARLRSDAASLSIRPPGPAEPGFRQRPGDTPPLVSDHVYHSATPHAASVFRGLARRLEELALGADRHIVELSIRLQVAGPGAGLGEHSDGDDARSGGFAFYLTEVWDPHWGGVLICFDPASEGIAHVAILPKRNRLVLLRNPIRHLVTPVAAEAGAHRRLACAGYYRASPSP